jgi:chorismate synthase
MGIRFLTAGESHGRALTGIVEGMPAGLELKGADIDSELQRRQGGYGRGGRMKIESDKASLLAGIRWGRTLGSPIALTIDNMDFKNWAEGMSPDAGHKGSIDPVTRPRPGHADLAGALKYGHSDVRDVLERSSARETAMRVAVGAVMKRYLAAFGVSIGSYVLSVGEVEASLPEGASHEELHKLAESSGMRCPDAQATARMKERIDRASEEGHSLGGVFEVFAVGLPVGLGSHVHWDRKLDGRLARALMSIPAIKGVEIGLGFGAAVLPGSEVMDEIKGVYPTERGSNNSGGLEGGITNGMPLVARAAMKPIPTLRKPLKSVDIATGEQVEAAYERSDICAVPAASVIGEAMAAIVLAEAFSDKFGGDSMDEALGNHSAYIEGLKRRGSGRAS